MATFFYARVSTLEQTLDHQADQARLAGFEIDEVIADHGVSGIQHRLLDRPQGKRLFDKLRQGDHLVVRWVDRLGRNYEDVTDVIRHFIRSGVTIHTVINKMTFDGVTNDPVQQAVRDALIGFLAATAQAQAEATKFAQRAGIDAAKGDRRKYPGRKPSFDRQATINVRNLLGKGMGTSLVAKETGLSRQAVLRIRNDPDGVERALQRWGL
ncbi:recombinase family protein [Ascidiaceihabitans sp.]|uniref:recombinase family protein n=1 Tax=Ascidiaceihabitans sp. TaxID=1872644 RepID=UPI003297F15F